MEELPPFIFCEDIGELNVARFLLQFIHRFDGCFRFHFAIVTAIGDRHILLLIPMVMRLIGIWVELRIQGIHITHIQELVDHLFCIIVACQHGANMFQITIKVAEDRPVLIRTNLLRNITSCTHLSASFTVSFPCLALLPTLLHQNYNLSYQSAVCQTHQSGYFQYSSQRILRIPVRSR